MDRHRDPLAILIGQAARRGFVTFQEVNAYLPDEGGSPRMTDELVLALEERGLDLIEDPDQPRAALATLPSEKPIPMRQPGDLRRSKAVQSIDQSDELSRKSGSPGVSPSDPVRMYLSQMGDLPLLKRDREIYLAKKIEASRKRFRRSVMECHYTMTAALGTLERVFVGELPFERTVRTSDAENASRTQILGRMRCNLPTIRHLLDRNAADFNR